MDWVDTKNTHLHLILVIIWFIIRAIHYHGLPRRFYPRDYRRGLRRLWEIIFITQEVGQIAKMREVLVRKFIMHS